MGIVETTASYLCKALAILIDILNPEKIVIGSIYARNEELFKPFVDNILNREAITEAKVVFKIVPASLGVNIGVYAALCVSMLSLLNLLFTNERN